MGLGSQPRAVLDGLNATGTLPLRQFTPQQVCECVLEPRTAAAERATKNDVDATDTLVTTALGRCASANGARTHARAVARRPWCSSMGAGL